MYYRCVVLTFDILIFGVIMASVVDYDVTNGQYFYWLIIIIIHTIIINVAENHTRET